MNSKQQLGRRFSIALTGILLTTSCSNSSPDITVAKAAQQMSRDGVALSGKSMLAEVKVTENASTDDANVCARDQALRRYKIEAKSNDDVTTGIDMASGHMIDALNALGYEIDRSAVSGGRDDQYVAVAHKRKDRITVVFIIQKYAPNIVIAMSTSCLPSK